MKKTILTSAFVIAALGLGVDANAEHKGRTADHRVAPHSHHQSAYEVYPKKNAMGRTEYQPETYAGYEGTAYIDSDGRAYMEPHMEDEAMHNMVGSPQGFDPKQDNVNAPTVKAGR